ncbi:MAG: thiamine diphosphokinase [Mycoplasmatales bacterium]
MNIAICISGNVDFDLNEFTTKYNIHKWIAVDGGYDHLVKYKIKPEILIGDMDSIKSDYNNVDIIKLETKKFLTDYQIAKQYVLDNYNNPKIHLVGIVGNDRLEHFISNLRLLDDITTMYTKNNIIFAMCDRQNLSIKKENHDFISFLSIEEIKNFNVVGCLYKINNMNLSNDNIVCISNEFEKDEITIKKDSGKLMIMLSGKYL